MKNRDKSTIRKVARKVWIYCEGSETEYNYFNGIKKEKRLTDIKAAHGIEIPETKINTAKELVKLAKAKKKEFPFDTCWVVFDKDGYTKHPQAFNQAKDNNINIAFSSVSFEYWFLLHFEQTSKPFKKADALIKELKKKGYSHYEKTLDHYAFLKSKTKIAISNAIWLRKGIEAIEGEGYKCYECDAYTDVDKLVDYLLKLE